MPLCRAKAAAGRQTTDFSPQQGGGPPSRDDFRATRAGCGASRTVTVVLVALVVGRVVSGLRHGVNVGASAARDQERRIVALGSRLSAYLRSA